MPLFAASFVALTAVTVASGEARAAEPEAIKLDLQADASCVDEAGLRSAIASLHGDFRDAAPTADARIFRIIVKADGAQQRVRFVIDDAGHERSRESEVVDCKRALRTAALFVSLALDEHHEPHEPAAEDPPIIVHVPVAVVDTAEPTTPSVSVQKGPSRAAVGLTLHGAGDASSSGYGVGGGLRAFAGGLVGWSTYVGFAATVTRETSSYGSVSTDGFSEKGGLVVGWGAPWTSGIVGLGLEAGILHSQSDYTHLPNIQPCPTPSTSAVVICAPVVFFFPSPSYVAAYGSATLVFQLPESVHVGPRSLPLHPFAMLGLQLSTHGDHSESLDLGLAWNGP